MQKLMDPNFKYEWTLKNDIFALAGMICKSLHSELNVFNYKDCQYTGEN